MHRQLNQLAGIFLVLVSVGLASGDILYLHNGGKIEGELRNPDESPREKYVMRLEEGADVVFKVELVKKFVPLSASQKRYKKFLPKMPDTAAGNWKMADWCKANGLRKERRFHAEETIRHDPEHLKARRLLGYVKLEGKWTTREEYNRKRGFVRHEGVWRMPQEVALLKRRRETELAIKGWYKKVKLWRSWLGNPKRNAESLQNFAEIEDKLAVNAIAMSLHRELNYDVQAIYIDVLGRLDTLAGAESLIAMVLSDCDEEIRLRCLDRLENSVGRDLAIDAFIKALGSSSNATIYRAGIGLTRLPAERAIRPLINALVSEHKVQIESGSPGGISTSFGGPVNGGGSGGINFGAGGGPKFERRLVENESVLDALVKNAEGANFQYDQDAWLDWFIARRTPMVVDLRRGP